jgi:hypothetical protein
MVRLLTNAKYQGSGPSDPDIYEAMVEALDKLRRSSDGSYPRGVIDTPDGSGASSWLTNACTANNRGVAFEPKAAVNMIEGKIKNKANEVVLGSSDEITEMGRRFAVGNSTIEADIFVERGGQKIFIDVKNKNGAPTADGVARLEEAILDGTIDKAYFATEGGHQKGLTIVTEANERLKAAGKAPIEYLNAGSW